MIGKARLALAIVVVGVFSSGCASIVEGTDQSIQVNLSPNNATCVVSREGEQIASVSRDDRTIRVGKSKNDLDIECRAPGYLTENLSVESSASGWGVIGCIFIDLCVTDYSTGALNKYPKAITIALTPETFQSEQARDEWVERRRHSIETEFDKRISDTSAQCDNATDADACKDQAAKLRKDKQKALDHLKQQRAETRIAATPASAATHSSSVESRLKTIKDLFDRGLITKDEYERKRQEIVSGI